MPSLLDLLGGEIPVQCSGRSLKPFLQGGQPEEWRSEVHWEVDFRYLDDFQGCFPDRELGIGASSCAFNVIRDHRYKYIHFADLPPLFFDLKEDPYELNNLAADPAHVHLMFEYCRKLLSWRMQNDENTLSDIMLGPDGPVSMAPRTS
jgi:arylsulfatase A-like enzyme